MKNWRDTRINWPRTFGIVLLIVLPGAVILGSAVALTTVVVGKLRLNK